MGRHSLPDGSAPERTGARSGTRRRTLVLSTGLVLAVVAGSVVALGSGLLPFGGPCDGQSARLDVAASPDIAPALEAVANTAREDATRTDGRCLDVRITTRTAGDVADAFGQRPVNPEFQVWIPDSSLWVDRVDAERGTPLTAASTLASSPIALGVVARTAGSLGWPGKTYTWTKLIRTATSGDAPRLGVADPAHSATGLLALDRIGAANAKDTQDSGEAGTRTAATAKLLHQRIADSDGEALATLPRDGSGAEQGNPRRNQALLLSEQAAYAHNAAAGGGPRLDLFYPQDGTARLDYPYTLVDDVEMSPEQTRAASRFMTLLGEADGQRTLRRTASGPVTARRTRRWLPRPAGAPRSRTPPPPPIRRPSRNSRR